MIQGTFAELKILVAIALFLGGETASSQSYPVLLVTAYLHFENSLKGAVAIISFTNLNNFFQYLFFFLLLIVILFSFLSNSGKVSLGSVKTSEQLILSYRATRLRKRNMTNMCLEREGLKSKNKTIFNMKSIRLFSCRTP